MNKRISTIIISLVLLGTFPVSVFALGMPVSGNDLAGMVALNAQAYIVQDVSTGEIIIDKNSDMGWTPASLTKLVTALVVLDSKTKLTKKVTMTTDDQIIGGCSEGGACIKVKANAQFTVDALFHALLIPSANNAASALARSTGMSAEEFADAMNKKVASLGAINTHFNEPTGMDPTNIITAADYVKILTAAFSNTYLRQIAGLQKYTLTSANTPRYSQTLKNTDSLLGDADVKVLGAKTGYLNEAHYNFASLLKYQGGRELAVVVLGEKHLYSAFIETKLLANLAEQSRLFALQNSLPAVLGASVAVNY